MMTLNGAELRVVRASRLLYTGLIVLYPREVRHRFGVEMADVFEDLMREAAAQRGLRGIFLPWGSVLRELLTVALPLRLASNSVIAGAISFLAASALFLVFFRAVQ
jgi:hypothetical protein